MGREWYTTTMKKLLFGIFAHPDDEAFGPSGTMLSEVKQGAELHLFTLTAGEHGSNPDNVPNLREVRLEEWRTSGKLMGARGMTHLGFIDGKLNNHTLVQAAEKIEKIIRQIITSHATPVEADIISTDLNGITGHIDHIVASRAAHQVFYSLKHEGLPLKRLRLVCIPRKHTGDEPDTGFVFMEPGRLPEEIDETIDNRRYLDEVQAIMRAHHTQREDGETHLRERGEQVAIDHFIVKT